MHVKQISHTVTYLGSSLDENLSGESMGLKFFNKNNIRLRCLYDIKKNKFMSQPLRILLYNALIAHSLISIMHVHFGTITCT